MASFLQFDGVSKSFGALRAVDSVSLGIQKGEFFSLLGPSGCGKTTLLRMLAGFETPDTGRILLDGEDITALPPNRRKVNTIFQSYALFPHLTVRENIAFGPRVAGWPRERVDEEVGRMLALTQLEPQARKKPAEISGGQKQRVAIARALINKPDVLLLDEPLAALDLKLRQRMLIELDLIHDQVGITFLYVTHDQGEAMSLSDRIAVMKDGRIEQMGPPAEIYETPRTSFVAAFIGDTNFLEGKVAEIVSGDYCRLEVDGFPEDRVLQRQADRPGQARDPQPSPGEAARLAREAGGRPPAQRRARPRRGRDLPRHPHEVLGERAGAPDRGASSSTTASCSTRRPRAGSRTCGSPGTPTTRSCSRPTASPTSKLTDQPPERVGEGS